MEYSTSIAGYVKSFLDSDGWHYKFSEDSHIFDFTLALNGKLQQVHYNILIRKFDYSVYAVCPMSAKDCLSQMAEFISRANYGLANGNFELDFRDGEIRYKCFVNCHDTVPGTQAIRDSIYIPASMFNKYSDGILSILFNMKTPAQAVADCEAN